MLRNGSTSATKNPAQWGFWYPILWKYFKNTEKTKWKHEIPLPDMKCKNEIRLLRFFYRSKVWLKMTKRKIVVSVSSCPSVFSLSTLFLVCLFRLQFACFCIHIYWYCYTAMCMCGKMQKRYCKLWYVMIRYPIRKCRKGAYHEAGHNTSKHPASGRAYNRI